MKEKSNERFANNIKDNNRFVFFSALYVAIKKKEISVDLLFSGIDFFPYAFLLIACYYFYNKKK